MGRSTGSSGMSTRPSNRTRSVVVISLIIRSDRLQSTEMNASGGVARHEVSFAPMPVSAEGAQRRHRYTDLMEHHSLLPDIGLAILTATLVGLLAHWLRQPIILGYLVAGAIVGPLGLAW